MTEPGAAAPELRQLDEGDVGAMAHADVVLVDHHALGHPVLVVKRGRKSRRRPPPGFLDEAYGLTCSHRQGHSGRFGWVQFESPAQLSARPGGAAPGGRRAAPPPALRPAARADPRRGDRRRRAGCRRSAPSPASSAISRNTVIAALDQLSAEGLLESRRGSGIQRRPRRRRRHARARTAPAPARATPSLSARGELMAAQPRVRTMPRRTAFHPGTPELAEFPFKTWSRLLARHARFGAEDLFGYHYMSGYPGLREVIAGFLTTMRRVRCTPEQIVVTTGGQAALDLLARVLLADGRHGVDGGARLSRRARRLPRRRRPARRRCRSAATAGRSRRSPTRRRGSSTSRRRASTRSASPCRSSSGSPSSTRRGRPNAWVIEDDFDGEYTFRGQPLPAMQGLDDESRVIYVGTFSKTLFPAMRLGFIVLPRRPRRADQAGDQPHRPVRADGAPGDARRLHRGGLVLPPPQPHAPPLRPPPRPLPRA